MTDFLKKANGEAIRADLIHTIFQDGFKVYGTLYPHVESADTHNSVVLLEARSREECEVYINSVSKLITYYPSTADIEVKARFPIYEYIDEESKRGVNKINKDYVCKRFEFEYHWSLVHDTVEALMEKGYLSDQGMGNFNVMAWPTFKAIQMMLNTLFYYYSDGYSRHINEIRTKLAAGGETNKLWPAYPLSHANMVIQALKDKGYFKDTEHSDSSLTMKEPEHDYDEDGHLKVYKIDHIRDVINLYDPADFVDVSDKDELEF